MRLVSLVALSLVFFSNNLEGRLYFMHIPKTGGSSLRFLLESQVSHQDVYPYRTCAKAVIHPFEEVISGHFPFLCYKHLDNQSEKTFKVMILRDPVERYLSFLRSKKRTFLNLADFSLEEIFNLRTSPDCVFKQYLVDNAMCRYLAANPLLEGQALLESAKQTLNQFDYVIFYDRYVEDVVDLFQSCFEIELSEDFIPHLNSTKLIPTNQKILKKIEEISGLDLELYNYAKDNILGKKRPYVLRTPSFEELIKKTSHLEYTFDLPLHGKGWGGREVWGENIIHPVFRWVMEKPASIYFSLEEGRDYSLYFTAYSIDEEMKLHVHVNGEEIEVEKLNENVFSLYHATIPKECLLKELTEISFFSNTTSQYIKNHRKNQTISPPLSFAINYILIDES